MNRSRFLKDLARKFQDIENRGMINMKNGHPKDKDRPCCVGAHLWYILVLPKRRKMFLEEYLRPNFLEGKEAFLDKLGWTHDDLVKAFRGCGLGPDEPFGKYPWPGGVARGLNKLSYYVHSEERVKRILRDRSLPRVTGRRAGRGPARPDFPHLERMRLYQTLPPLGGHGPRRVAEAVESPQTEELVA